MLQRVSAPAARVLPCRVGYMLRRRTTRDTERVAPARLNPAFTEDESIKQSVHQTNQLLLQSLRSQTLKTVRTVCSRTTNIEIIIIIINN